MNGQRMKQTAVDCVGFVDGVLQELHRYKLPALEKAHRDLSLHSKTEATRIMLAIAQRYPSKIVHDGLVEPGDVVVVRRGEGPGHVLIAGDRENVLWHAAPPMVCRTGLGFMVTHHSIEAVFRLLEKHTWL